MRSAQTDTTKDSASTPDVLANLASFGRHLRAGNRSPTTIKVYAEAVRGFDAFLAARGMPRTVAAIRREHVEAFIEEQLARLRPSTAASRYRSLQQFFRWLVDEGELRDSPMARMHPPAVPDEPPPILGEEQLEALRRASAGTDFEARRDRAILSLLVDTGMRRAELAGLRLADLDRDQGVAIVMGKGRRPRAVPYDRETARDLDRYIDRARAHHPHADSPHLWLGKKGRLTENGIAQLLRRRGRKAGLEGLHAHLFRHTFAHRELARGMQETTLMRLAGWKSRQMVGRYGASVTPNERAIAEYRALRERGR